MAVCAAAAVPVECQARAMPTDMLAAAMHVAAVTLRQGDGSSKFGEIDECVLLLSRPSQRKPGRLRCVAPDGRRDIDAEKVRTNRQGQRHCKQQERSHEVKEVSILR